MFSSHFVNVEPFIHKSMWAFYSFNRHSAVNTTLSQLQFIMPRPLGGV